MSLLPPEKRAALSRMILDARRARPKKLSREGLSMKAETALRKYAQEFPEKIAPEDRELYLSVEITHRHVHAFENCPAAPLSEPDRRARLLGICLALELDLLAVNRVAGGLG